MTTRREALKMAAASIGAGGIAGCTEAISDAKTFEATPALAEGRSSGSVVPMATSQIIAKDRINPIGDVVVRNYGATSIVFGSCGSALEVEAAPVGEILTVATPKISPPGLGEQNPVAVIDPEELVSGFGSGRVEVDSNNPNRVAMVNFDGAPAVQELFAASYFGSVQSMNKVDLRTVNDGVRGTVEVARQSDGFTGQATVGGTLYEHGGDYVLAVGWVRDDVPKEDLKGYTRIEGMEDVITHPDGCPDNCVSLLERHVSEGRGWVAETAGGGRCGGAGCDYGDCTGFCLCDMSICMPDCD